MNKLQKFDWKATIRPNIAFLHYLGIWPEGEEYYKLNFYTLKTILYIIILVISTIVFQVINIFFTLDDLTSLTANIYVLLTEILYFIKLCFLVKNMPALKLLMKTLDHKLFQPKANQIVIIQPLLNFWKLIFLAFVITCSFTVLFWAIFPILDSSEEEKRLPLLAWYPYDTKISPNYELTYLHQVASYIYICYSHLNIDTFITALNTYIQCQFDILCDNLKNIKSDTKNVDTKLAKCIKHHLLILMFANTSNEFFSWIIFFQFTSSAAITGMTLFQLTVVKPFTTEFYNFMAYVTAEVVQIFMYCWFGNEVQVKSSNIPYAAFGSDWTEFSPNKQKSLLFLITRSQKSVKMSAFNVFDLTTDSFVKILKSAWSYFALLNQVNS
ncbi:odorant receptor Or1 isoform X1 [Tribolium castaneum]|nr:PREDICTED: odorant receptor Or1 isoform X1 [Tribolium castaneum]XP_015838100.1 PREDICTED: odorant receptor Or1 isoform X1 [Tribolium castaneum]XP_015838101.1 PREDICTED: odorant receptor Or1 isoform X1 [Tribolium castaneum]|eukprot:XP_015838099.1 PREDICTED: odorant receptor Or1 isoform X1 [Tribolium castaneum]